MNMLDSVLVSQTMYHGWQTIRINLVLIGLYTCISLVIFGLLLLRVKDFTTFVLKHPFVGVWLYAIPLVILVWLTMLIAVLL